MKKLSERVTLGASKAMRIGKKLGWDVKKRASGRTDYVTFTKDGKKYGPVDASILTQDFLMRKLKEKLKEKFASKAQQRYLYATDPEAAEKLGDKMTKKDYKELPDKVNEDYSQRARNFRVNLRKRLEDMKPGKKVKIDKLVFKKLPSGDGFTDKRGKFFDLEQVVQAIQKGPALNMIYQNKVRSPRGKEQVDAYVKFEGKLNEKGKGLWHNIHKKRKRGEAPAKKGTKAYNKAAKAIDRLKEEAPPGMEDVVLALKKKKDITNPYAVAWAMYNKKNKK